MTGSAQGSVGPTSGSIPSQIHKAHMNLPEIAPVQSTTAEGKEDGQNLESELKELPSS